nr:acyltransferase [uncultured bacterium]
MHVGGEVYIGYTVNVSGRLDLDALATAYAAVCRAFPQLSARLEDGDDGPVFAASRSLPEIQVRDGDLERPLTGVELDQRRALSALGVTRDGDDASVSLLTHHGIGDAGHSIEVLAALWSCYTDAVKGGTVELPRQRFPRALEDLLAERGIHGPAPVPALAVLPTFQRDAVVRYVVQHRMTVTETAALTELGHRENVTVNGLLAGVLLLVEAEVRDLPVTELLLRYSVNLRDRLTPKVGPTEGTNVLGGVSFTVTDDIAPDPVAIGRAVGGHLRAALADGSAQRSLLDLLAGRAPGGAPWDPSRTPAVVSMMNWGVVPPLRAPDELRLTGFRSASRIRESMAMGGYVVSTFGGRTGIDLAWPEGAPELPRRLEVLRERLGHMTRQP